MDSFDYDSLDRYIRKFKRNIINKLESTNLSEKDLKNQSDLLCMVLDYSPKMYDEKKFTKKIEIKPSALLLEDLNIEKNNIRSLILEKQVSNDESSFDSDKEQTIKLSRLSSKICRGDLQQRNQNGKTPIKESFLFTHVKELLYEIVSKAISVAENNVNLELKISSKSDSPAKSQNEGKENDEEKLDNLEDDKVNVDYDVPITSEREKNILSQNIEELELNKENQECFEIPNDKNKNEIQEKEADPPAENKNENKNSDNKYLEDDEEEEFFRQCQNRRQKMEDKRNSEYIKNIHNTISHSKFANKLRGTLNVKIYILNQNKPFTFEVSYTDTIKDLKLKIFKQIEKDSRFKLNYKSLEAYELRMIDDDSDDVNTKFEMPALADKLNVCKTGYDAMAFVEKNLSSLDAESLNMNILGSITNNTEIKVTLKVHFKFEKDGNKYTIIQENGERTLKNVLEKLSTKNKINYRNFDLYYFIEHTDSQKEELDDMDNAIGMETQLKFLNNYELDLYFKKFPDAPESSSVISSYLSQTNMKNYDYSNTYSQRLIKKENDDQGREFLFNDRTAGAYQEFEVIKINKYKSKQERILGIDMYNLYNDLPKQNAQPNLLKNIFFGGTKKPLRRIRDIVNCGYLSTKMFFIEIKSNEGKNKQIIYEVKQVNTRNEIVAKVKYLIKMHQSLQES